jgi:PBSX family phage portal protein
MSELTRVPIKDDSFLKSEVFDPSAEFKAMDPFSKDWNEVRKYAGIEQNFKRRADRMFEKQQVSDAYMDSALATQGGREDAKSKAINPGVVYRNAYGLFDVITPPYNLNELANYYDTSFANHAAIDAKVENTVGLGYDFQVSKTTLMKLEDATDKDKLDKARKRIERLKVQLRDWLESLNDDESFTSILEKVMTDVNATGNGYIEIGRTLKGEIGYDGHIPSTTMRVRRLHDGFVQMIGNKVTYFRNFGATNPNPITGDKRPNEIIHIKEYSPLNTFYGVPDVIAAMPALIGDSLAAQYNIDYFQNKAVPRYVVTLKGAQLSADAEDKLFRFLQTGLKGQNHRTLYIPLPGDSDTNKVEFRMDPIEAGIQEASFNDYRVRNRDDILVAHQVPLSKIGGGDAAGVAAAISQDRTFKEQVTRPEQTKLEKVLNKIIREKTDVLEFKFNELTLTDEVAQSQIHERYVRNKIITPNEVRDNLGLPQFDGGDEMVEQTARQVADANANTQQNRERDAERTANQSDGEATTDGRNPKGEGRASE